MIGELPRPWTQPHERRNLRDYSCVLPPFYNLTSGPSGHQLWTHESPQLIDPVPRAFSDSVQIEKDPWPLTESKSKLSWKIPSLKLSARARRISGNVDSSTVTNAMEYSSRFGSFLSAGMGLMERDYTRRLAELKGEVTASDPAYWP